MKTIQSIILNIKTKKDKNHHDYLILELENQENILVFANQVNPKQWNDLKTGKSYQFNVKEGKNNGNILVDYEKEKNWGKIHENFAQKCLSHQHPNKNQEETIYLNHLGLDQPSELILDDYPNLKKIDGYGVSDITKLTISNCPQLEKINIEYFERNQELTLNNLPSLKELYCCSNNLNTLEITNCTNLQKLDCSNNHLIEIKLPQGERLEELNLSNNNFQQDLSFLSGLVALRCLYLRNNKFKGVLNSLKNLSKLEKLNISDTKIIKSLKPLQGLVELKDLNISNTDIDSGLEYLPESIKRFYCSADKRKDAKVKAIYNLFASDQGIVETDWKGINKFLLKFQGYKKWRKLAFVEDEIKQWIEAGSTLDNYEFVNWLKNTKKETSEWIANYKEDYQALSERFKKYGLCQECNQPNTGDQWCKSCNSMRLQQDFTNWTSHNPQVDEFIQKYQLEATEANKFLEWIPYEQFAEIEYLAEGGFGKVYKAKWTGGNIHHWDAKNRRWIRDEVYEYENKGKWNERIKYKNHKIVLKSLNNSSENTDFLQETEKHKIIDDWFQNIVPCYGISQDPNTGNYLMVMQYMPEGNLRHYLSNKNKELTLQDKLSHLAKIAQGLKDIHQKSLVHRDFHSGNILKGVEKTSCLITDLGLCKPVNETNREDKIFGVMPYVAPEVLRSQPYTQKSDIYSFGMVTYEVLSGLPPYYDREHDTQLGLAICQGLRPQFQIKIPQLLEDLINRCWDTDPNKRPTAQELEGTLRNWKQNTEFKNQLQEAEEYNQTLPDEIKYPEYKIHQGAYYNSKLLPTKEITCLLQTSNLQNKTLEINNQLTEVKKLSEKINTSQNSSQENLADALVKAFNRLLDKSRELTKELEEIIATNPFDEEAKKALKGVKDLKTKLINLQKEDDNSQKMEEKKIRKEKELDELKNVININNKLDEDTQLDLNTFLKNKKEATENNNDKRSIRELERSKKELKAIGINEEELDKLCQLQKEITELEMKLQQSVNQKTQQLTQIINNIGFAIGDNSNVGNVSLSNNEINNFQNSKQQAQIKVNPFNK